MDRPRIGIPLCLDDRGRWHAGRQYHYIDQQYAEAVDRTGGTPIYLPIQNDPARLLQEIDGLLLPGGDDLPPEAPLARNVRLDLTPERQTAFDTALVTAATEKALPILGICYGMQLLARFRGGKLVGHLPTEATEARDHALGDQGRHPIRLQAESALAAILGEEYCSVNSLHHQGVSSCGPSHRPVAHAEDGLIEAIEIPSVLQSIPSKNDRAQNSRGTDPRARFEIGVQWHPEKMTEASTDRLFGAFVEAASARSRHS